MSVRQGGAGALSPGREEALLATARAALRPLAGPVGLAVSGGGDSMAMLQLMALAAPGLALEVVTVDHRLRPEAATEAALVARVSAGLGLSHTLLVWDHATIRGNLMQAAREARYRLIAGWATARGIGTVMLAHTADDQAETFLLGLARASGLDGLVGMRAGWVTGGIRFQRPLLGHGRAELRQFLRGRGLPWVEDPTNEDDRHARVRARRALAALEPLGITTQGIAAVTGHLAMAQAALRQAVAGAAAGIAEEAGSLRFAAATLAGGGGEVERRLLRAMLGWIGGIRHPPREAKLAALIAALRAGRDATLAGVRFRWQDGFCTASREPRAVAARVAIGALWDGRWRVTGATGEVGGEVGALGAAGLRLCPDWRQTGHARQVLEVTPAVWQGERLIAAPLAGFGSARAECTPSFSSFLLSH